MPATWNGQRFKKGVRANVVKHLWRMAIFTRDEAIIIISQVVYDHPQRGRYVRTGNLRASIQAAVNERELYGLVGVDKETLASKTGTKTYYAPFVEFGTYKMKPRPYLRPALGRLKQKKGRV